LWTAAGQKALRELPLDRWAGCRREDLLGVITDPAKPANEVITDFGVGFIGVKARKRITVSACEPFRERIERAHLEGRNAMGAS